MIYQFKNGNSKTAGGKTSTPSGGKQAQVVGERLAWLRETQGILTPKIVVEDARPSEAPLHDYFEWHDEVAAEKWRVEQARNLIKAVVVVEQTADDQQVITRAFISVEQGADAHYEPLATVLSDSALYAQVCARASAELEAFQDRYAQFTALKSIGKAAYEAVQAELQSVSEAAVA